MQQVNSVSLVAAPWCGGLRGAETQRRTAVRALELAWILSGSPSASPKSARRQNPRRLLTADWRSRVRSGSPNRGGIGRGTTVAREIILTALKLGKPVITANKALLSRMARNCSRRRTSSARISITKPASAAAFPSSKPCGKLCGQSYHALYGSSMAPALYSSRA